MAGVRYVVFDFDGTCTQIDRVQQGFLDDYGAAIKAPHAAWHAAQDAVRAAAPNAGWTVLGAPSTAPAGADPYILAFEAAQLLVREKTIAPPPDVFKQVYTAHVAPFRPELVDVLGKLAKRGIEIGFISNSGKADIEARLDSLGLDEALRKRIHVTGGASKFLVRELPFAPVSPAVTGKRRAKFERLPAAAAARDKRMRRPLYLRRGAYFEALCAFYDSFGDARFPIAKTLVVGDIYELDLALPQALGAKVHLVERAEPFPTYRYERAQLAKPSHASADLEGVLKRV
jgi:phosphoglycolate phosphatase-like HAD superfamily hydrolase